MFSGSLALTGVCYLNEECLSGWCDDSADCPGECADPVALGGDCSGGERCEFNSECINDVCEAEGGPLGLGDSCSLYADWCGHDYLCDPVSETCQLRLAEGEACDASEECRYGLICSGNDDCVTMTVVDTIGEACDYDNGLLCNIFDGMVCMMDFGSGSVEWTTCEVAPVLGEMCVDMTTSLYYGCDWTHDIYCDSTTENCEVKKANGQPCGNNIECLSNICDEGGTDTCLALTVECFEQRP